MLRAIMSSDLPDVGIQQRCDGGDTGVVDQHRDGRIVAKDGLDLSTAVLPLGDAVEAKQCRARVGAGVWARSGPISGAGP